MKTETIIGIFGLSLAVATFAYQIYGDRKPETVVSKSSRFYCALQADPTRGGDVWTVLYRRGEREAKPWLRMVRTMGEDWDTRSRCEEIADRLDIYRQDGLLGFDYREDPSTPGQYVICAKTQLSKDSCQLVVTLAPEDNPYEALHDVAGALLPGRLPSYQCNEEATCPLPEPVNINLSDQLMDEDL